LFIVWNKIIQAELTPMKLTEPDEKKPDEESSPCMYVIPSSVTFGSDEITIKADGNKWGYPLGDGTYGNVYECRVREIEMSTACHYSVINQMDGSFMSSTNCIRP
jgi:hypothetical protein